MTTPPDDPEDWQAEVDEIERRRARAAEQGGAAALARQHAAGRLSARERIAALVDPGSFSEVGAVAGAANAQGRFEPANLVLGLAKLDGRDCVVAADDFTSSGGAYSPAALRKGLHADELALRRRMPLVRLLEGGGASVKGASGVEGRSGYDLTQASPLNQLALDALASVPVVCAALGPVAGYPAGRLVASHLSLMTETNAQVLTGGPVLVERALGQRLDKEQLGGAAVHLRSGVVDNGARDEAHAFEQIRAFLSYLPGNVWESAPRAACDDPPGRRAPELLGLVPRNRRRAYKIRRLVELVVDAGSCFELRPLQGRSQFTALARLAGQPVGVLANDCHHDGGAMSAQGARKVRRFVELCDAFHLPIVSFVDEPGFLIGPEAERAATIRYGMEAMFAALQSEVPWCAVVVRRAFGVAAGIHLGRDATVWAWPSAEVGALPVESGVALAYRKEIEAAPDPAARRRELEEQMAAAQSILPRAADFGVHDLIDPRETRPRLCAWADSVQARLRTLRAPRRYSPRP